MGARLCLCLLKCHVFKEKGVQSREGKIITLKLALSLSCCYTFTTVSQKPLWSHGQSDSGAVCCMPQGSLTWSGPGRVQISGRGAREPALMGEL